MRRWTGWPAFAAWAIAGALLLFSFLSALSIGVFILPFAVIATVLAAGNASARPEVVGLVAGGGVVCLLIAFLSRNHSPCPESGVLTLPPGADSVECGGFDPAPWLAVGLALVVASSLAFVALRRWGKTVFRQSQS